MWDFASATPELYERPLFDLGNRLSTHSSTLTLFMSAREPDKPPRGQSLAANPTAFVRHVHAKPDSRRRYEHASTNARRMSRLIDNVLDFARGRLGGGLTLQRNANEPVDQVLNQVVAELRSSHLDRTIETKFDLTESIKCDASVLANCFQICSGTPSRTVRRTNQYKSAPQLNTARSNCPSPILAIQFLNRP